MSKNVDLTSLQINDTHGYFESHNELFWRGDKAVYKKAGGYARIATLFKQIKNEKNGKMIVLDNVLSLFAADQSIILDVLNFTFFSILTIIGIWTSFQSQAKLKKIRKKKLTIKKRTLEISKSSKAIYSLLCDCVDDESVQKGFVSLDAMI